MPRRRLVFTFGWEQGGFPVPLGSSTVVIELEALGESTRVSVRHDGLTTAMAEQHTHGWVMFVDQLASTAERSTSSAGALEGRP